jgi:RNA polymerase primary sigma factor
VPATHRTTNGSNGSDPFHNTTQALIDRACEDGVMTYDVLVDVLDGIDDRAGFDTLLDALAASGVSVHPPAQGAVLPIDLPPLPGDDELTGNETLARVGNIPASDPIGLYFGQMAKEPLLTADEEVQLAKRIELGYLASGRLDEADHDDARRRSLDLIAEQGQAARRHLGRANTRLVISIAKNYMGNGMPFADLIQEGNVGLMRAVDKYDYMRGYRFSTYATWWIRQAITRGLAQKTRTIRIPLHLTERIRTMYRAARELEQEMGRRPTPEEIADALSMTPDKVRSMMDASRHAIALETPVGEDGDSEFGQFIEDESAPAPAEVTDQHLLQESIDELLNELTPRQAHILRLRFGLGGGEQHTLQEIADRFGLSRERIRQLEKTALRRLRHPRFARTLRSYLA